jgi:uncharacterized protein (DUF1501 family)
MNFDQSRRAFLQRSAALGIAGGAAPFVNTLGAIGEAAASTATDYKALVCVFLYGGNDYANTLVPYDQTNYDAYARIRPVLATPRANLAATLLNPAAAIGGRQYALAPTMSPLIPVFDAGKLAVMLNVGTLAQPTTKAQYQARSVPLPPKLFSHNDQQSYFQSSSPEGANSGWGGRMGDLFMAGNGNALLTCVSPGGNAVFLSGRQAVQYSTSTTGPIQLSGNTSVYGSTAASTALKALMTGTQTNVFANEHARVSKRSLDTNVLVTSALAAAPTFTTVYPTGNNLADQMKLVARMISVSQELGAKRQVFFVSTGGFDLHDNLNTLHPGLLGRVAGAMRSFYDHTVELGISDKVTTFTGSDFGRTLVPNDDGSDHGWGSMHFVMGGAVRGQRYYGTPPTVADNGPEDVGQGRLLPGIAVDQYAATLASWFGVANGNMTTVLPNMGAYNQSTWNLGFV